MSVIEIILIVIACLIAGFIAGYVSQGRKKQVTDGKLKCQRDPDDGLYLFLELEQGSDPMQLLNKKYAIFEVDPKDIVSHE